MTATILLTEADADIRAAFSRLLRRAGYRVVTACDRATGWQAATHEPPDLVMVNLPEGEGLLLCRQLRADARTRHIPVLLMSAALYPDAATAAAAGAEGYLTMPLPNHRLLQHVSNLLPTLGTPSTP